MPWMFCFIVVQVFFKPFPSSTTNLLVSSRSFKCVCTCDFVWKCCNYCLLETVDISWEKGERSQFWQKTSFFQLVVKIPWIFGGMLKTFCLTAVISSAGFYLLIFSSCFFPTLFFYFIFLLHVTWNWLLSFSFISCMFCCHILFVFQKKTDSCRFCMCVWLKSRQGESMFANFCWIKKVLSKAPHKWTWTFSAPKIVE